MRSELRILISVLSLTFLVALIIEAHGPPPIARQGCKDHCGNVSIPFPFGIGPGCFLDKWFEIECKTKPKLTKFSNMELVSISTDAQVGHEMVVKIPPLSVCASETPEQQRASIDLRGSPFHFAHSNLLMVEGCSGNAVWRDEHNNVTAGCGTVCGGSRSRLDTSCYRDCCQTVAFSENEIRYLQFYHVDVYPQYSNSSSGCLVATLISTDLANGYVGKLLSSDSSPVTLIWRWISKTGADNTSSSFCWRGGFEDDAFSFQPSMLSLVCNCVGNSYGNAYVNNGCQVPQQCKHCRGFCKQDYDNIKKVYIPDSYHCERRPLTLPTILGLSISLGILLSLISLYGLYRFVKRIMEIRRKAKFFKRNGGLLLRQQLSSNYEGDADGTKIYSIGELDKATDYFNENRVLGQGGQGTVYKGIMPDGRIVAIKKAKLLDESQLEQFINEVVILSQINHRNVVKLFGCCLETEVPLLVYEFIPNGTLFEHIHDPDEDFAINWEKRLKIVQDSACAIAYLHSSSSIPIYHRDIKSSNILLDERHRAKVSDFGSSKTIAIDQTHLTTLVQGTMGYLDPEYFQSYQFTDKSDVYSFGVVLLEMLTSQKPIYKDSNSTEQKNLVTEFSSLVEQSTLSSILHHEVVREAKEDELVALIELAKRCVSLSGKLRPTMKEVAMTLEMIIKSPHQVSTLFKQHGAFGSADNTIAMASREEFMANTLPASSLSSMHIDVKPRLLDTI